MTSLLPANATQFERDVELATQRIEQMRDNVDSLWDPWTCPVEYLPFLAWSVSVDVWIPEWPETRKRSVIAHAIQFHYVKGTLTGLRQAAALSGATLEQHIVPPAKTHVGTNLTADEWSKFLGRYPQFRTYQFRVRTLFHGVSARSGGPRATKSFIGAGFVLTSTAKVRLARRVVIYEPLTGESSFLTTADHESEGYVEARIARPAESSGFLGVLGSGAKFMYDRHARTRLIRVEDDARNPEQQVTAQRTVHASVRPIRARSEQVFERGFLKNGMFPGARASVGGFPILSTAQDRVYSRRYLFDKRRSLEAKGRSLYVGTSRLGFPHHVGELRVKIATTRPKRVFDKFVHGFLVSRDKEAYHRMMSTLRWNKRSSTKMLVSTRTAAPLVARNHIKAGSGWISGDWRRIPNAA